MPTNKDPNNTGADTTESAETTNESKPRTEAQQDASRINGSKSQGPTSIQGKTRSSQNAIKLGLHTSRVVLSNESQKLYNQLLADYIAEWSPAGITETDILVDMVNARWRLRRVWAEHTAMQDMEMFWLKDNFDANCQPINPGLRQGDAAMNLAVENPVALENFRRAEAHLYRVFQRAHKSLVNFQTMRLGHPPKLNTPVPQPAPARTAAVTPDQQSTDSPSPEIVESKNEPGGIQVNFTEPEVFSNFSHFKAAPRAAINNPKGRTCPPEAPPADRAA